MKFSVDEFSADHPDNPRGGNWTRLKPMALDDMEFINVCLHFYNGWLHPHKPTPSIKAIYKFIIPEYLLQPYQQYRERVTAGLGTSNEQLLFHGTTRACLLGDDKYGVHFCMLSNCHLCSIIRNSFDISKRGTATGFLRFGPGIYTTSVSSKADDYCKNKEQTPNRVVLLNRVVVGYPHRRQYNAVNLTSPPSACNSIVGDPGVDLNYQETVVYTNAAIRPAYMIVYGEDD